eukprot:jgi/Mesvir1/10348/Mv10549-RA.1
MDDFPGLYGTPSPTAFCNKCKEVKPLSEFTSVKDRCTQTKRCDPCRTRERVWAQKHRREQAERLRQLSAASGCGPWRVPASSASCPPSIDATALAPSRRRRRPAPTRAAHAPAPAPGPYDRPSERPSESPRAPRAAGFPAPASRCVPAGRSGALAEWGFDASALDLDFSDDEIARIMLSSAPWTPPSPPSPPLFRECTDNFDRYGSCFAPGELERIEEQTPGLMAEIRAMPLPDPFGPDEGSRTPAQESNRARADTWLTALADASLMGST